MHFMKSQLEPNTPAVQLMQVTNRMISDLEGRGTMRSAPETCNLNAYLHDKDVLAAEFIRTYMAVVFPGVPSCIDKNWWALLARRPKLLSRKERELHLSR